MKIGYACLTVGVFGTKQRTCIIKNATPDVLKGLIQSNLESLDKILDYNIQNNIRLFRISSDIIPFGSHPINTLGWWCIFSDKLKTLGQKALQHGMRLSMHPGQYTVLNSPDETVVARAVEDLRYHAKLLDSMALGKEHKIILHVGGIYGDKSSAIKRFIQQYKSLDENIRHRLVIENDDRQYTISDVLSIGNKENIPVVFDNLHHQINPDYTLSDIEWIDACKNTWKVEDGTQKIHYSQQHKNKRHGSHSATIHVDCFLKFYTHLQKRDLDIMLEVKDKNLSAIKCINAISSPYINKLEKEWERYKYVALERSPKIYNGIRELLKNKNVYPILEFYSLIDELINEKIIPGNAVNTAQHIWGYVNDLADDKARASFEKKLDKVSRGGSRLAVKRLLWKLAVIQNQTYLLNSLYFAELF